MLWVLPALHWPSPVPAVSFGSVIAATNIGDALISTLNIGTGSVVGVLLFAYFIGFIFRVAQGSGTVAGITSMTIMATVAPSVPVHPVWIAMACGWRYFHRPRERLRLLGLHQPVRLHCDRRSEDLHWPIFVVTVFTLIAAIIGALLFPHGLRIASIYTEETHHGI